MNFFTLSELGAEDEQWFHPGFLDHLENLRAVVARPFIVTSCCRSLEYNKEIDGSKKSTHIWDLPQRVGQLGCAGIDLKVLKPDFKPVVAKVALLTGWSMGVNDKKNFIHLDRRMDWGEPQALFSY